MMGLYIKEMKMPKDDVHAFKQITITNNWVDGEVIMLAHDTITNEFIGEVVEVPEPHGRLIDVDEIPIHREGYGYVAYLDSIVEMPTVIEAEGE